MLLHDCPAHVVALIERYVVRLFLPADDLFVTTDRRTFTGRIGRTSIPSQYGGAYCFVRRRGEHVVLINLARIDQSRSNAVEIVVAEELLHMRHWLDADRRRHARHGYDRIAVQVADLVGTTLDDVRAALLPVAQRPYRYVYECPACRTRMQRRRRGRWACARCARRLGRVSRYIEFQLVEDLTFNAKPLV